MAWIPIPGARKGYYSEDGKGRWKKIGGNLYFRISGGTASEIQEFYEKGKNILTYCDTRKPTAADPPPSSTNQ